jgi:basic membrane lipoprotein Med (substrate-binding protein (PBP1-ABC) superfamily)
MSTWVTRWRWVLAGGAFLVAVGVVAALLWPSGAPAGPYRPPLRVRSYNAFTICLLTGPQGIASATAAPVWAGVEEASNETSDQAQYLAAAGSPETVESVTPFVDSLVQQQCGVIVAVGPVEVLAAQSAAALNKSTKFILVGKGSTESNVRVESVTSKSATTAAIETAIGDQ